jgi:hypothetical protein
MLDRRDPLVGKPADALLTACVEPSLLLRCADRPWHAQWAGVGQVPDDILSGISGSLVQLTCCSNVVQAEQITTA